MSLQLPFGINVLSSTPVDAKYLNSGVPYTSVAEVNTTLESGVRHIGLTVNINNVEYWYADGTDDSDLVLKTSSAVTGDTVSLEMFTGFTATTNSSISELDSRVDVLEGLTGDTGNSVSLETFTGYTATTSTVLNDYDSRLDVLESLTGDTVSLVMFTGYTATTNSSISDLDSRLDAIEASTGSTGVTGYTANNGILIVGNNIELGGNVGSSTSIIVTDDDETDTTLSIGTNKAKVEVTSGIGTNLDYIKLVYDNVSQLAFSNESVKFADHRTSTKGIEYLEDYSDGFVKHSMVDVNYVTGITSTLVSEDSFTGYTASTSTAISDLDSRIDTLESASGSTVSGDFWKTTGTTYLASNTVKILGNISPDTQTLWFGDASRPIDDITFLAGRDITLDTRASNGRNIKLQADGSISLDSDSNVLIQPTGGVRINSGSPLGPTAWLHLPAGSATASKAPLKFISGTALTTPEDGAMEYHNSHLYFTIGSTRYQLDQQSGTGLSGITGASISSGQVAFLEDGVLKGDAGMTYDSLTNTLHVSHVFSDQILIEGTNNHLGITDDGIAFSKITESTLAEFSISAGSGIASSVHGQHLALYGGHGYTGNNNGGNVFIYPGLKTGTGRDGSVALFAHTLGAEFGDGGKVLYMASASTNPTGSTSEGGILYVDGSDSLKLKYKAGSTVYDLTDVGNTTLEVHGIGFGSPSDGSLTSNGKFLYDPEGAFTTPNTMVISDDTGNEFISISPDLIRMVNDNGTSMILQKNQLVVEDHFDITVDGTDVATFESGSTVFHSAVSIINDIVSLTGATTLDATYAGKIVECSGTFTVTLPDGMPIGWKVTLVNVNSGVITIAAATTLQSKDSANKLSNQFGGASIYHRGSNVWLAVGDLTA